MAYITDRKRVLGLGVSRAGTAHHWQMLVTSILLVFLVPAFVITFALGLSTSRAEVLAHYANPLPALITVFALIVGIYHLMLEVRAAVEDYVHGTAGKLTLIAVTALSYGLIGVGIFCIARIAL